MAAPPRDPEYSIVICSIDPQKYERVTRNYRSLFADRPIEIIGIHDARSLAEGYNRGIAQSRSTQLILSHDDVEILTTDFAERVAHHLRRFDLIGIAGTTRLVAGKWDVAGDPYTFVLVTSPSEGDRSELITVLMGGVGVVVPGVQALDGVFWAMRREVAENIAFDAATFDHFHLYDLDFTFRAYLAGYRLAVCRDLIVVHESLGNFDQRWELYRGRFERKFAGRLAPILTPKEGARARFASRNREEILRLCDPVRLTAVIGQIEAFNAAL